ncbi:MAG: tRNA epoxyqueuosine(34) reductase QueG, partial [Pseudomonadales bacterium]
MTLPDFAALTRHTRTWGKALGFDAVGVTDTDPGAHEARLNAWLAAGRHGEMDYMARHGARRSRPEELIPGTCRVITTRMNYLPGGDDAERILASDRKAFVSRYALGRDYHKVIRSRLVKLWQHIETWLVEQGQTNYSGRVFTDSAPVLEKALAEKSGLGWIGKNTLLLSRDAGSWFFLGEIYTDVPLVKDDIQSGNHCGTCRACIDICPTDAIVAPYELDARKCISYLTIEHRGTIPVEYRSAMGNRIFGCDDCQMVCPWNKYAKFTSEPDFSPRHQLDQSDLLDLFAWSKADFLKRT